MPPTVPAVMKDMFQRGLNEAEEAAVKKQICDGLIERIHEVVESCGQAALPCDDHIILRRQG